VGYVFIIMEIFMKEIGKVMKEAGNAFYPNEKFRRVTKRNYFDSQYKFTLPEEVIV
jgi:hypothetical protein